MVIFQYNLYIFGIHLWTELYQKLCYNEWCYREVVVYMHAFWSDHIYMFCAFWHWLLNALCILLNFVLNVYLLFLNVYRRLVKEEYLMIILEYLSPILQKSICCGYWLEVSQWGTSNEYPQHKFLWRNKEIYPRIITKYSPLKIPLCLALSLEIHCKEQKNFCKTANHIFQIFLSNFITKFTLLCF